MLRLLLLCSTLLIAGTASPELGPIFPFLVVVLRTLNVVDDYTRECQEAVKKELGIGGVLLHRLMSLGDCERTASPIQPNDC